MLSTRTRVIIALSLLTVWIAGPSLYALLAGWLLASKAIDDPQAVELARDLAVAVYDDQTHLLAQPPSARIRRSPCPPDYRSDNSSRSDHAMVLNEAYERATDGIARRFTTIALRRTFSPAQLSYLRFCVRESLLSPVCERQVLAVIDRERTANRDERAAEQLSLDRRFASICDLVVQAAASPADTAAGAY